MPAFDVSYYTDPLCPWSWALEPARRKLLHELGQSVRFSYVMCGIARQLDGAAPPSLEQALADFGTMAPAEVAAICELPGPRAPAELWHLATQWRVQPERVGSGELWTLA
jgi:predicted DsbA family dithiol-disulfide isomerase